LHRSDLYIIIRWPKNVRSVSKICLHCGHDTFFSIYWYFPYQYISVLNFSMWLYYFCKTSAGVSAFLTNNAIVLLLYACAHEISLKYLFPEQNAIELCCQKYQECKHVYETMNMFFMKHTSYSFNMTSKNTTFIPTWHILFACAHEISLKYLFPEQNAIEICCQKYQECNPCCVTNFLPLNFKILNWGGFSNAQMTIYLRRHW
jgi:hypothetical protein